MATWRIWPSTSGPALTADVTSYSLSTEFAVSAAGCSITGYWWWCPTSGDTTAKTFSLWSVTTGTAGTRITAANATSGTLTAGAWNFTACTPTALTSGQHYRVEVTFAVGATSWYGNTAAYWSSGGGSADIVNGPLKAFTQANATGNVQGGFIIGGTPAFTTATSGNANYWIDVQVDDGGGAAATVTAPARPGQTWLRRFRHRQVPQPAPFTPQTIQGTAVLTGAGTVTAGTAAFPAIPAVARPGQFTPGNPGGSAMVLVPPAVPPAVVSPARPGQTWLRRFRHRQVPQAAPAPAGTVIDSTGATLTGAGTVTAAGSAVTPGTAALAAAGAVTTNVTQVTVAPLAGAGTVTGTVVQQATATLAGGGTVTAKVTQIAGAALTGAGTATSPAVQIATATLTGAGVVTAFAGGAIPGTAALAGAGTVTAAAVQVSGAALAGAGTVSAKAAQGATAGLAGAGTVTAAVTLRAGAALAAAGTVTAAGSVPLPFTTGILTASDTRASVLTAATAPSGTLTARTQSTGGPQ